MLCLGAFAPSTSTFGLEIKLELEAKKAALHIERFHVTSSKQAAAMMEILSHRVWSEEREKKAITPAPFIRILHAWYQKKQERKLTMLNLVLNILFILMWGFFEKIQFKKRIKT